MLVFSKTEAFRHASIEAGVAAIEELGDQHGFAVDVTEDASEFTEENLAQYAAVVWNNTSGDVLDLDQQNAFQAYIREGGGFVGIHAAADTHHDWQWYGDLVGAYFETHASPQPAELFVYDRYHPSTDHLPARWNLTDEWYVFDDAPRGDVHVLLGLNQHSVTGPTHGHDHPLAWCHDYDGGRSWYTGLGDSTSNFEEDENFRQHIAGGILWSAGMAEGDCGATVWDNFDKVTLTMETGEPMSMVVLPDGRVIHTNRQGSFRLFDPSTASSRIMNTLPVYDFTEDGMQGIALDPDFEENNWLYVYYSPEIEGFPADRGAPETVEEGDEHLFDEFVGYNRLSRFKFVEDPLNPFIDLDSEQTILEVPIDRGICCHNGGDIAFDSEGNLYLSTGDDSNPFAPGQPIDERPTRNPAFDAQRSSANTADLRGKLIRITVQEDGSYTVPEDNMFNSGEWDHLFPDGVYDPELALPEIYAMGFRNPFRFTIDPRNDRIYLGHFGGPKDWRVIHGPMNAGWPYCGANNNPFNNVDFETGENHGPFDCDNPVNDSPNNTGLVNLPPASPAPIWWNFSLFPELTTNNFSGGNGPMGGPTYIYDPDLDSPTKWPQYYEGIPLMLEWARDMVKQMILDDDGQFMDVRGFHDGTRYWSPIDHEFGPEGSLYVLEYGGGFNIEHPQSRLSRIDYVPEGRAPRPSITATPRTGQPPLEVQFSSEGTFHPDADPDRVEGRLQAQDFDSHGRTDDGIGSDDPGVQLVGSQDPLGGEQKIGWITDGDYTSYRDVNFAGVEEVQIRYATNTNGGIIEFRQDAPDGDLLGSVAVSGTGGFQAFEWATAQLTDPGETFELFVVNRRHEGTDNTGFLVDINFFDFGVDVVETDHVEIVSYAWDFGDGSTSEELHPVHTYTDNGVYNATLTVTDNRGLTGVLGRTIVVGNTEPVVELQRPPAGAFFDWHDEIPYRIRIHDVEDTRYDCDDVILNSALGHDAHAHPMGSLRGCDGFFGTPDLIHSTRFEAIEHGDDEDVFWTLTARYTDQGGDGVPSLTGEDDLRMQPRRKQAQHFTDSQGVTTGGAQDSQEGGNQRLNNVNHGNWVAYDPVNFLNVEALDFRVRTAGSWPGGTIEVRKDAPDGELLGTAEVPNTGGSYTFVEADVVDPGDTFTLYLVFTNPDVSPNQSLLNLNFFEAVGEGAAGPPRAPICHGNVHFDGDDTGVADRDAGNDFCVSWTLDDMRDWATHGQFMGHVGPTTDQLVADGVITEAEKDLLVSTAAKSDIGK